LFYRAWAQAQPTVSLDRPRDDRFSSYVGSLCGLGDASLRERDAVDDFAKLFYCGLLARQIRNRDGLVALLAGYFRLPVDIEQHVGHWMPLQDGDRTALATEGALLGRGAVLGRRVWDRQHKFRVIFGPLDLPQFESFLPGGAALAELVAWVRQYLCFELAWDLRLVLKREAVPAARLGRHARLAWSSWLGSKARSADAPDLILDAEHWMPVQPASAGNGYASK
jgi:type VI secretion system protein ImpH